MILRDRNHPSIVLWSVGNEVGEAGKPGRLIGVDNGDLRSHEPYQSNARTTYWGRVLAIVQSTSRAGEIRVTAQAEGIEGDMVAVQSE